MLVCEARPYIIMAGASPQDLGICLVHQMILSKQASVAVRTAWLHNNASPSAVAVGKLSSSQRPPRTALLSSIKVGMGNEKYFVL